MGLKDKHVLLCVTGSISAYKACDLVQRLKDQGAQVRVVMTHSATLLVHPNTFAALTAHKVATEIFSGMSSGQMEHIDLARWADLMIVAPCTAHTLSELAGGLTGSMVSLVYLAFNGLVFIAPAMNSVMWHSQVIQRNVALLKAKGDVVLPTGEGVLACGEVGYGKLIEVEHLIGFVQSQLYLSKQIQSTPDLKGVFKNLQGKKVLLSLGHTREKWDDVRFFSNRSSGKTGLAFAKALKLAGADVELVAGGLEVAVPPGFRVKRVTSSADFQMEMLERQKDCQIVIMAAAIADFVPKQQFTGKRKGSKELENIELVAFPNILSELGLRKSKGQILVGFALETENAIAYGQKKLNERNCDLVVVNNPVGGIGGFGKEQVQAAVLVAPELKNRFRSAFEEDSLREWQKEELAARVVGVLDLILGGD